MHILLFVQTILLLACAFFILEMCRRIKRMITHYEKLSEHFKVEREMHDAILNEVIKVIPDEQVRADLQGAMALGRLSADREHAENNKKKG